jgi:predicted Zn-dependent protease
MRMARLAVMVLAMVASAWFVLGIRQAHDTTQAQEILSASRSVGGAQARKAESLLSAAAQLNPDQEVQVLRGRLALAQGDKPRALAILQAVTRAEPRSREAWLWLAQAAIGLNPALFNHALKTVFAIDPPPSRNH